MNGRFYLLGAILSLVLHGALFFLLAVGSCKATPSEKADPAGAVPVVSETNAAPTVAAKPDRVTDPFAEEESPVAAAPVAAPPVAAPPVAAVPVAAAPVRKREAAPSVANPEPTDSVREWNTYVVKKGDNLTLLSKKAGCSASEIARMNKKTVAQMAKLRVGQKIKLPLHFGQ